MKKMIRLSSFAVFLLLSAAPGFGVWLARSRAYGIVHPGRVPLTHAPDSVGITNYTSVSFLSSDGLTLRG